MRKQYLTPKRPVFKYLTYDHLEMLNDEAVDKEYNRSLYFENLPISEDDCYPVALAWIHNGGEFNTRALSRKEVAEISQGGYLMRSQIVLNRNADMAWLDISIDNFLKLPEINLERIPEHDLESFFSIEVVDDVQYSYMVDPQKAMSANEISRIKKETFGFGGEEFGPRIH